MDVVLVGLPGSGKSVVGRRLSQRHKATFIDIDERIEHESGRAIPDIFAEDGEAAFRALERRAVTALGPADQASDVRRVIATGGGAVVDPRNRWSLYLGRATVWLDGRPEVLAQRLRRSPNVRPLVQGRDPIGTIRDLAARRERFYAAATIRSAGVAEVHAVVDGVEGRVAELTAAGLAAHVTLLHAETPIGRIVLGDGIAAGAVHDALERLGAARAILVSEPGAWEAVGARLAGDLETRGTTVERVMLPQGEDAKRLSVIERAASELARLRVRRDEPIVAIGGGALGDAAGFLAATYLRGVPIVHVPTTLVAQVDSSIGGKTGVDLPEGKNLIGAFHQPAVVVIDVAALRTLPERHRRAALGEAVKRCAWAKVAVVLADERERDPSAGRITLNLGHSLGHAVEAAAGFGELLHGEAVAYGLRAATRIGVAMDVTPADRAERIGRLLDRLQLARDPLPYPLDAILGHLAADKKHGAGGLRWVLPTADGVTVRDDVDPAIVEAAATALLAAGSPR
jgi:shikimate kinase/3-dehydroquinate synthase